MIQTMKTMMADVTMPAIAPGAMEPGPEVLIAAVREEGMWGRKGQVKGVVAKANL